MERRKIFIMITILLVLLFLVIYFLFFTVVGRKFLGLYKPTYLKSEQDIQDTIVCDPEINIQKCSNLGEPCIQCKGGLFSCQEVKDGKITAQDPYGKIISTPVEIKDQKGNSYTVPDGKWCLPATVDQKMPCNLYTSTPILTKYADGLYKWRCYCKYPNWIASSNIDGDCTEQIACSHQRDPQNNYLVYCKDSSGNIKAPIVSGEQIKSFKCPDGTTEVKWEDGAQVDLENDAFCKCAPNELYYFNKDLGVKECVADPCGGKGTPNYDSQGNLYCNCDDGYISCSQLPDNKKGECAVGCLENPCAPDEFTPGQGCKCKCEDPNGYNVKDCGKGRILIPDQNYLGNGYCVTVDQQCDLIKKECQEFMGGKCTTCPEPSGVPGVNIQVPYCHDCKYYKGYKPTEDWSCESKQNCASCLLVNANCGNDEDCCTGRCHKPDPVGPNPTSYCMPCNMEPHDMTKKDAQKPDKLKELQGKWDGKCKEISNKNDSGRNYCNLYDVGACYSDVAYDGRVGICEKNTCSREDEKSGLCVRYTGQGVKKLNSCNY